METLERIDPAILYSINLDGSDLLREAGKLIAAIHLTPHEKPEVAAYVMQSDDVHLCRGTEYKIKNVAQDSTVLLDR